MSIPQGPGSMDIGAYEELSARDRPVQELREWFDEDARRVRRLEQVLYAALTAIVLCVIGTFVLIGGL
jgi:hypothetical protein